ncbi:MAG: histone deacetylase [Acidobacteriota bacterium]
MGRTGFVFHPLYTDHLTGLEHPEKPERVLTIVRRLRSAGLLDDLDRLEPEPVETCWLEAVHDAEYIRRVQKACQGGRPIMDSSDTAISAGSYHAARLAAGGGLAAADRVMDGTWSNAFVACRPPGHHAESSLAMGFCLFNNAAVTAAYLRRRHGVKRVAIVDWDVHHGNGTQHLFEEDPSVYYISLHQWPLYPGTGRVDERGRGKGRGATLNCPMDPGDGDDAYLSTFESAVLPELERFSPGVVILSAGFDAHAADPLSATQVTAAGFRRMSRLVIGLAGATSRGRIVSLLEGGYDLEALAGSVQAHVEELRGAPAAPTAGPGGGHGPAGG